MKDWVKKLGRAAGRLDGVITLFMTLYVEEFRRAYVEEFVRYMHGNEPS